jgi:hypothetical protein
MNRIRLETLAAILDENYVTLRQQRTRHPALATLGVREGRDLMFDLGEAGLFALVKALHQGNRSLEASVAAASGLAPIAAQIGNGELGGSGVDVFAVLADRADGTKKARIIAEGLEEAQAALGRVLSQGFSDARIINLSDVLAALFLGWGLATGDPNEVRKHVMDGMERLPPEQRATLARDFRDIERRLQSRQPVAERRAADHDSSQTRRAATLADTAEPTPELVRQPKVRA